MTLKQLKTNKNEYEIMNAIINFKDMPKELQAYIKIVLYNNTVHYQWSCQPDFNRLMNNLIGFQICRDYYKHVAVYYLSKGGFYSSVKFGKLFNKNKSLDLIAYTNYDYSINKVIEQLSKILTNRQVIHDYNREQFIK